MLEDLSTGPIRVLIAEDETIIRMDLRGLLEKNGMMVVGEAANGAQAVELARTEMPDVAILDLRMPELDGVEAANHLVNDELRRTPTLLGLDKLLDARLMGAPPEVRPELSLVKNLVHGYAQKLARYQCSYCGFKARQFYWQCPGCSQWETYPPRRTEELNVMN